MLVVRLIRLFRGFLVISVTGRNVERFINICMRRNILLWDIKRVKINSSKMKISIEGFREVREIARKSNCSVHILEKRGMPFSFFRHRQRSGVLFGLTAFAVILFVMTSFVWRIEIEGNERVSNESVLASLKEAGVYEGKWRYGLDLLAVQNRVLLDQPDFSWVGVNIYGSKIVVSVSEERPEPLIVDRKTPCNLVATKGGMIETVIATDGVAVVKPGDTVNAGDLLISGINDSARDGVRYLHAMGSVRAKTWKTYEEAVYARKNVLEKTGESKSHYTLNFLNFEINFFKKGSIPYAEYDTIETVKEWRISERFYLPISLKTVVYEELTMKQMERTLEEAREETLLMLEEQQDEYQVRHVNWTPVSDTEGKLTVTYETIEEIAIAQAIGGT